MASGGRGRVPYLYSLNVNIMPASLTPRRVRVIPPASAGRDDVGGSVTRRWAGSGRSVVKA